MVEVIDRAPIQGAAETVSAIEDVLSLPRKMVIRELDRSFDFHAIRAYQTQELAAWQSSLENSLDGPALPACHNRKDRSLRVHGAGRHAQAELVFVWQHPNHQTEKFW